jgi:hypothetical protein
MLDNLLNSDWISILILIGIYLILKELGKILALLGQLITNLPSRDQASKMNEQLSYINSNTSKPRELSDIEKDFEKEIPYYRALAEADRLEKLKTKSSKLENNENSDYLGTKPSLEDYDYDTEKYEEALTVWLERKH